MESPVCLFVLGRVSHSPAGLLTCYVVKDDFELLIFLLPPPKYWVRGMHHAKCILRWGSNQGFTCARQLLYQLWTRFPAACGSVFDLVVCYLFLFCFSFLNILGMNSLSYVTGKTTLPPCRLSSSLRVSCLICYAERRSLISRAPICRLLVFLPLWLESLQKNLTYACISRCLL